MVKSSLNPNPEYTREIIRIVNSSPYPCHMSMRLVSLALDRTTVELEIGDCHLQPYGIVHGGVLSTLIDTATFWSVFMRIPETAGLVNIDLKLNYLQAVQSGKLIAEGYAIRSGRSISYAEAKVFNEDNELIAHGTSTLKILPGKGLKASVQKFL
ncbi:MAG: PaaI family thioesterase [Deltaproteobacteria bacterium]|nr:PaaI family thioesterase [Candidatus Tharpella sp.]